VGHEAGGGDTTSLVAEAGRLLCVAFSDGPDGPDGPDGRSELRRLEVELERLALLAEPGSYERGRLDGALQVLGAVAGRANLGLAPQTATIEPGSLAERLLLEIDNGVHGANADLAERLGTDQWQLSRAGRRLRDLGLAERTRTGRLNLWRLTSAGDQEARRRSSR